MTLEELYREIGGDYAQAMKILRIEKLLDKHIRKLPENPIFDHLAKAGETMDPTTLFEASHAVKGVCGNLGLTELYALAVELSEEFRPGNARRHTDAEVKKLLEDTDALYQKAVVGIREYEQNVQ